MSKACSTSAYYAVRPAANCERPCRRPVSDCCAGGIPWTALFAEYAGTIFTVLFSVGMIARAAFTMAQRECCSGPEIAIGLGLIYAAATYFASQFSGAHFNPIVTLSALVSQRMSFFDAILYWVAQLAGAITAGALSLLLVKPFDATLAAPFIAPGYSLFRAVVLEAIGAIFLVLFLLTTTRCARNRAAVYGVTIAAIAYFTFALTGAVFSPWRHLGVAIFSNNWVDAWVYYVANFGGALIGAIIYIVAFSAAKTMIEEEKEAGRARS